MSIAFSVEANSGMAGGVSARRDVTNPPHSFSASRVAATPGAYWKMARAISYKSAAYWMIPLQWGRDGKMARR
jgi:hypothetical protein